MNEHAVLRLINLFVHLHLLSEPKLSRLLGHVLLAAVVWQHVELKRQVVDGQVVLSGMVLKGASQETYKEETYIQNKL